MMQIIPLKFGTFMISLYLCSVRTTVLTTPLSAGSKTLSPLLHFRSHLSGWLLFFVELSEKPVKSSPSPLKIFNFPKAK